MIPKNPVFEQHWHEFTVAHPEIVSHSRYILEANREEPALNMDAIGFCISCNGPGRRAMARGRVGADSVGAADLWAPGAGAA
jgi:hypothetical protein